MRKKFRQCFHGKFLQYKSEYSFLKYQNSLLELELQPKKIIVEKLLKIKKDQSKISCFNKLHNKHDNSRSNFDNIYFDENLTLKNKSVETPQFKVTRKTPFNTNKKKIIVVGDSITKLLRSDQFSTSERLVTVINHPGC